MGRGGENSVDYRGRGWTKVDERGQQRGRRPGCEVRNCEAGSLLGLRNPESERSARKNVKWNERSVTAFDVGHSADLR